MRARPAGCSSVSDGEIAGALERFLGVPVAAVCRKPSRYATSAALEEVDVRLAHGDVVHLALKDMSRDALLDGARRAKPAFLYDPAREIDAYRLLLADADLGTARCYAAAADERHRRYWLLLERVVGVELYQVGELARWEQAARWLARMHDTLRPHARRGGASPAPALVDHGRAASRRWMERAVRFAPDSRIDQVVAVHEAVLDRYGELPVTVLHGEFFASNVLLSPAAGTERVCAVDWEMAGLGPGLHDLAALVSGDWPEETRIALARAYHEALDPRTNALSLDDTLAALDVCRLQLCVQLLGWSSDWSPPGEHLHDWLGEALGLVERLQL